MPAGAAPTLAFTAVWTAQAAPTTNPACTVVGMIRLLVGVSVATLVVSAVTRGLQNWWGARRRS